MRFCAGNCAVFEYFCAGFEEKNLATLVKAQAIDCVAEKTPAPLRKEVTDEDVVWLCRYLRDSGINSTYTTRRSCKMTNKNGPATSAAKGEEKRPLLLGT